MSKQNVTLKTSGVVTLQNFRFEVEMTSSLDYHQAAVLLGFHNILKT